MYLISYKSRHLVLSSEYKHKAHNNNGIFQPIIAHQGVICGNWSPNSDDLYKLQNIDYELNNDTEVISHLAEAQNIQELLSLIYRTMMEQRKIVEKTIV